MTTHKAAIKQTAETRELVRRAGAALETVIPYLPESEQFAAAEVVRACSRAELPRDVPAMPRGNYTHQEALLDEARTAGCGEEVLGALVWHGPLQAAEVALTNGLGQTRQWAASTVALSAYESLFSVMSAQFVVLCYGDGDEWRVRESRTWWPMIHNAREQAGVAMELAALIREGA